MASTEEITKANELFGFDAYKELAKKPGNLLLCPLSIETILSLTLMGAGGNTEKQGLQTLHLPADKKSIAQNFQLLKKDMTSENVIFTTANKIFVDQQFPVLSAFTDIAVNHFAAETENVDFKQKPQVLKKINDWVSAKTNNKIPTILDDVDKETAMILINAIYFNGNWRNEFTLLPTKQKFFLTPNDSVDVEMINKKAYYNYGFHQDLNADILEIPYKDMAYNLVIILPKEINGLAQVEAKLPLDYNSVLQRCEVNVTIPKFKLEQTIPFKDILIKLGMSDAFSKNANFSELSPKPVFISEVLQKTFIDVNEKGTEAAAATAAMMALRCAMVSSDPETFLANHPFVFLLKNQSTILFVGRFSNPR